MEQSEKKEIAKAYRIEFRNNSYEYLKNISINNMVQALNTNGYDERYRLIDIFTGGSIASTLNQINSKHMKLGRIRLEAHHPYDHYKSVQMSKPLKLIKKEMEGGYSENNTEQFIKLNQFYLGAVESEVNFEMDNGLWDIQFDMMPEITGTIFLWFSEEGDYKYSEPDTYIKSARLALTSTGKFKELKRGKSKTKK